MSSEKLLVKFKLIQCGKSKLQLVKAIHNLRHVTGWGLKESKEFVDSTDPKFPYGNYSSPGLLELNLTKEEVEQFKQNLEACDSIIFELDDTSKLRNRKLINLGLFDKEDLVKELVEEDLFEILRGKDLNKIREILMDRYSQIPENYLKEKLSIK